DPDEVLELVRKVYGQLPRGPGVPAPPNEEGAQRGARRSVVRHPSQAPILALAFRAPSAREEGSAELDLLQSILSYGDGSLLVRDLVHRQALCTEIGVDYPWRLGPGAFEVIAELPPKGEPDRVERAIWRHLETLAEKGPTAEQLSRAKLQASVSLLRELSGAGGRAHSLGSSEILLGSLEAARRLGERQGPVTVRSAREAARAVFRETASNVVVLEPA
ncbi:MAG: M16 family metallopeptidase, partial [Deltaproteobacteria bacterium]